MDKTKQKMKKPQGNEDTYSNASAYSMTGIKRYRHSLHTHPKMENDLSVPKDHVIIDRHLFEALMSYHGMTFEL